MNGTAMAGDAATSWVYVILFAIFFMVCVRLRGNMKFVAALLRDVITVRERENMFDNTMREASAIFFLLLLTGCSVGVLLLFGVRIYGDVVPDCLEHYGIRGFISGDFPSALACMGLVCCYISAMWICYNVVGRVFTNEQHTIAWVRGFTAGTGLAAIIFFPLALLCIEYPAYSPTTVLVAFLVLIVVKIAFIVKGFRIFFAESSSWVVFLYYLCSLEIVPLALTFGFAKTMLS